MVPAKMLTNGNGVNSWIKILSTAGVGAAFGAAALWIMVTYFIQPSSAERTKLTDTLTQLVRDQGTTNQKLSESLDMMVRAQAARDVILEQQLTEIKRNGLKIDDMTGEMKKANDVMLPAAVERREFHEEEMKLNQQQVDLLEKITKP